MSVQKEDAPKTNNTNNGLGWATAIGVGVGVGAALYYYFRQGENPNPGGTSTRCQSEQPFFMNSMDSTESDDYVTTTDTSMHLTESDNESTNDEMSDSNEECDNHEEPDSHEESDDHEVSGVSDESANDTSDVTEDFTSDMSEIDIDSDSEYSELNVRLYVSESHNIWNSDTHMINVDDMIGISDAIDFNDLEDLSDIDDFSDMDEPDVPTTDYIARSPIHTFMNLMSPRRARQRTWTLEECSICFDVILKNQEVMSLPCTHQFHTACILPWLQQRQTCPNCRKTV